MTKTTNPTPCFLNPQSLTHEPIHIHQLHPLLLELSIINPQTYPNPPTPTHLLLELGAEGEVPTGLVTRLLSRSGGRCFLPEQLRRQGIGRLGQELGEVSVQPVGVFLDEVIRPVRYLSRVRTCVRAEGG